MSAKAEIAPFAQRGRYFCFCAGVPKSLSGCGMPIDWCAESSALTLLSELPIICITRQYSETVKPSPPYSFGIFMPKAPILRSPSMTGSGYSPV